ncbi:hypothetical protein KA068_01750 [Candidatus Saccharibacteria bacterium]|nr:hypothetical protein [Candidatus Saccharibacteria bacterium]
MKDHKLKTGVINSWLVHMITASGMVCAVYSLDAILNYQPEKALIWLLIAQVIDGVDGPLARYLNVKRHVPVIDGNVLDLVIDYVTCVVVPIVFMIQFSLLPETFEMLACSMVVASSAIWFSRKDIETKDMWFRGFPTGWNLVVTIIWLQGFSANVNLVIVGLFVVLTMTPKVKFFHMLGSPQNRRTTVALSGAMLLATGVMILESSLRQSYGLNFVIVIWAVYAACMTIWRTLQTDEIL